MPDVPDCVVSNFLTTNSLMIVGILIGTYLDVVCV